MLHVPLCAGISDASRAFFVVRDRPAVTLFVRAQSQLVCVPESNHKNFAALPSCTLQSTNEGSVARRLLFSHAMAGRKMRRAKRASGFTLVELGAVVAIISILAVLAVASYRKYILHSKITEAQNGISAIKIAQEDFRAERGTYANIGPNFCPEGGGAHDHKVGWQPTCSGGTATWESLPVHMSGAVQFQYATVAGTGTYTAPTNAAWVTVATPPTGLWYVAMAQCDLDGVAGDSTQLVSMSFSNQIFSRNEGQ